MAASMNKVIRFQVGSEFLQTVIEKLKRVYETEVVYAKGHVFFHIVWYAGYTTFLENGSFEAFQNQVAVISSQIVEYDGYVEFVLVPICIVVLQL